MFWSSIEDQQDVLPGKSSRQDVKEALEACRVRCRHDQIDAGPVLRRDGAIQIDVFANELAGHLRPDAAWRPARPWPVDAAETRFIGEHDAQPTPAPCGRPPRPPTRAQQYYLDALTLLRRHLPPQCRFQSPDLALAAFDHLFPRIRCSTGNHRNRLTLGTQLPQIADSISYGVGISSKTAPSI